MGESKFGRKTSPGFADPNTPTSLETAAEEARAAAKAAVPVAPIKVASSPDNGRAHAAPAAPPAAVMSGATPQALIREVNAQDRPTPVSKRAEEVERDAEAARIARTRQTPMVEVEIVHERGRAPRSEPLRRCYEIWTQNTVYEVDPRMQCVDVRVPGSGVSKPDHPFVGARLVGGQLQSKDSIEMSYPLPRPGSFAVFESRKGNRRHFSRTSSVERVVLRLRIVTITDGSSVPSWDDFVDDM